MVNKHNQDFFKQNNFSHPENDLEVSYFHEEFNNQEMLVELQHNFIDFYSPEQRAGIVATARKLVKENQDLNKIDLKIKNNCLVLLENL